MSGFLNRLEHDREETREGIRGEPGSCWGWWLHLLSWFWWWLHSCLYVPLKANCTLEILQLTVCQLYLCTSYSYCKTSKRSPLWVAINIWEGDCWAMKGHLHMEYLAEAAHPPPRNVPMRFCLQFRDFQDLKPHVSTPLEFFLGNKGLSNSHVS